MHIPDLTQYAPQFFVMACVMLVFAVVFALFEHRKFRREAQAEAEQAASHEFLETAAQQAITAANEMILHNETVKITKVTDRRRKTSVFADLISPETEPIIPIEQVFPRH